MLPDENDEWLRGALAKYQPEAPDALATRIIARATAEPQKVGLLEYLTRAFTEWNYGLQFKGAALAAFAILGVLSSQLTYEHSTRALDLNDVALSRNWTEEL